MKSSIYNSLLFLAAILTLAGCATYGSRSVGPTPIELAKTEIPEAQLIDVGILVFETKELTPEAAKDEGTSADIRKAESHFMPYHLKNTLQQSGHWGAIQVIPAETNSVDLLVKGKILESNGQKLILEIDVADATGKRWFKKKYIAEASASSYSGSKVGEKDPYQDLYNTIANDMAEYKKNKSVTDIKTIRTVSQLKFAQEFAPDSFTGYIVEEKKGRLNINRLPANDDPMMVRLLKIRERETMYLDTLNAYYEEYYNKMWSSYENWRKLNDEEIKAIKKIKHDAMMRKLVGAMLVGLVDLMNMLKRLAVIFIMHFTEQKMVRRECL